jgi:pyruvate-formate lyase-activating enzyme
VVYWSSANQIVLFMTPVVPGLFGYEVDIDDNEEAISDQGEEKPVHDSDQLPIVFEDVKAEATQEYPAQ